MRGVKGTGYFSRPSGNTSSYSKEHYQENKQKYIDSAQAWAEKNPEKSMYRSVKCRAKKDNKEFTIELKDIIIPEYCPLLGTELVLRRGKGSVETNPTIDRIDSAKGYTKDNIQVMSNLANRMKSNATKEQLITFAKNILRRYT